MSANFRDIPANFRDIPANFRDICVSFFVSTRNMLQTCFQLLWEFSSGISPNFLGLPFSYLQPRLPFSYYVMERAAKACEEPENTWNDQKLRYFKFSSLSHPGSSKSRFCWISLFFLALRAPQVATLNNQMVATAQFMARFVGKLRHFWSATKLGGALFWVKTI